MADTSAQPAAPRPAKDRFLPGLLVGGLVGLLAGYFLAASQSASTSSGTPIPPAGATSVAGPNAGASSPSSAGALTITLGRAREEGEFLIFPLVIHNNTAEALSYAEADCAFYGKDNTLLAHAMTNMTDLGAGSEGSNDLMVQGVRFDEIDHYSCTADSR
ncbi:MAG: FxLYD domain-containing protein [Caulobacteraceae bacterium]